MRHMSILSPLLPLCAVLLAGCTSHVDRDLPPDELMENEDQILSVVLADGSEVEFASPGGSLVTDFDMHAKTTEGAPLHLRGADILEFRSGPPGFVTDIPSLHTLVSGGAASGRIKVYEVLRTDGTVLTFVPPWAVLRTHDVVGYVTSDQQKMVKLADVAGVRVTQPIRIGHADVARGVKPREAVSRGTGAWIQIDSTDMTVSDPRPMMIGMRQDGVRVAMPLDSILSGRVVRYSLGASIITTVGVIAFTAAAIVGIIILTKQSCPFLYSWNGTEFVFDGEPLGGATSAGLARTDVSRLEHLVAVDGSYTISVRNEVEETQYVDRLELLYCDHDATLRPVADGADAVVLVGESGAPDAVTNEDGVDVTRFFASKDGVMWQTHMASISDGRLDSVRHALRFRFRKPSDASRATVVIHGGTTLWGSGMIKVMYELQGSNLEKWHADADSKGAGLIRTLLFLDREELYTMRLYANVAGRWKERGTITGGGPLNYETQTVSFPLRTIPGDTLELLLRPPKGFWAIDEVSVSYEVPHREVLTPLPLQRVTDQQGTDIGDLLLAEDGRHYVMPTKRDRALMVFNAPPVREGCVRSIFARTSGYYRLHMDPDGPGDAPTIQAIENIPGEIVRLSMKKYREWSRRLATAPMPNDAAHPHP